MRPRAPIAGMLLMYIAGVLTGLFIGWVQDLRKKVDAESSSRHMQWGINGLVIQPPSDKPTVIHQ